MIKSLALLLVSAAVLPAATITYNFEDQTATGNSGAFTTLTETVGGLSMTVTRQNGTVFDIADLSPYIPSSYNWGHSTLSPFADTSASSFLFTFSAPISSFSVQVGDFNSDNDNEALAAYSGVLGSGNLIATSQFSWGTRDIGNGDAPATDSISGPGILSVMIIGGSPTYPNSLYYDNVMVATGTSTPEPASLALSLAGFTGLAFVARRKLFTSIKR